MGTGESANPVRKVVTMLQMIQNKVNAEAKKETELFDKYMCYCKTSGGSLGKSIADANVKIPELQSSIEEADSQKVQLQEDIKQAQADRTSAKNAMAEATSIREKEAADFSAEKADTETNIKAVEKAIAALEKGMGGSFLQSASASVLRKVVSSLQDMVDVDRDELLSFLSSEQQDGYAPQSGEIVGILKQIHETMSKSLAAAIGEEAKAIAEYQALMSAKTKEVHALTEAIETKIVRVGELGVELVQMKEDLADTESALADDTKFLADLQKNCATKEKEWNLVCKTRAEELSALADTIKLLNDDDALDLFKATLTSSAASFIQVQSAAASSRTHALNILHSRHKKGAPNKHKLDLIALAIRGQKVSFDKVIAMIDDMVGLLKSEQVDDDNKKKYCNTKFDTTDDKTKELDRSISDLETAISDAKGDIDKVTGEIKALEAGIAALDKGVAEATAQRKDEHSEYNELIASDTSAKELLGLAKNRLNKFYNPKLFKVAPKRELSEEESITVEMGGTLAPTNPPGGIAGTGITAFVQVSAHAQNNEAPPPPPEAVGAYQKKSSETTGVISMINLLVQDLDKEMTEAKVIEKDAQADYEKVVKDSANKRMADTKALAEKSSTKAAIEAKLLELQDGKDSTTKELFITTEMVHALHKECDWVLQYFDVRKEARADEIDSLVKAKAVLSGADYSFVQTNVRRLRHHP